MSDVSKRVLEKVREVGSQMEVPSIATATFDNARQIVLEKVLDDGGYGDLFEFCSKLGKVFNSDIISLLGENKETLLSEVLELCILLDQKKNGQS